MKKIIVGLVMVSLLASLGFAMAGPVPEKDKTDEKVKKVETSSQKAMSTSKVRQGRGGEMLIDDFESGSLKYPQEWWTFDIKTAAAASNDDYSGGDADIAAKVGMYSLLLEGRATNWYAGGCGTYIAKENQDLSFFNGLRMDVYGNGEGSGTLKIELIDDDNSNWQVEQDPSNNYAPTKDDKYVYDLSVDWTGWKQVVLPFEDFVDDNDGFGDDIWNPEQDGKSGGLLQVQFICISSTDNGDVNFNVDNLYLTDQAEW